jgi:hypothetical protein
MRSTNRQNLSSASLSDTSDLDSTAAEQTYPYRTEAADPKCSHCCTSAEWSAAGRELGHCEQDWLVIALRWMIQDLELLTILRISYPRLKTELKVTENQSGGDATEFHVQTMGVSSRHHAVIAASKGRKAGLTRHPPLAQV